MHDNLGILGVGHLAQYLVAGLFHAGIDDRVYVSARNRGIVRILRARYPVRVMEDNQSLVDACGMIIVSVRPHDLHATLCPLRFKRGQTLISVAAGVSVDAVVNDCTPASAVRALPVTSARIGASPTCLFPENAAARRLLERLGPVHGFDSETLFEAACVMGTYYGWLFAVMETTAQWLQEQGLEARQSERLVAEMTAAAGRMCAETEERAADKARAIARPGSLTLAGLDVMETSQGLRAWIAACDAVLQASRTAPNAKA